jgi:two-component system NtrC family sensor kinase
MSTTRKVRKTALPLVLPLTNVLLAAEDFKPDRRDFLRENGCEIYRVDNLSNALRLWRESHFDLVLVDAQLLLKVDSSQKIKQLRAQTDAANVPLVIFAQRDSSAARSAALEVGANDFFHFNLPPEEILWRLHFQQMAAERARQVHSNFREARFLVELGKNLLVTLEPEQVVNYLAGAVYEEIDAILCAVAADISGNAPTVAAFNREGAAEGINFVHAERLRLWLRRGEAAFVENPAEFLLSDDFHCCEFIAPLRVGERTKGIIAVGFDKAEDCTPEIRSLLEAAANYAAPSVHVTSLYDAALNASIYLVKEEQKKFTEAILDALPLSLYAIDRDYRIVAWNRHRELGKQGVPRESVMGRNVFDVLVRQPREVLEREFERAFATGQIERVEQKNTDERGAIKHWLISKIPMRDAATGEVTHVISVGEDITARVEATHAVARAEKLAAVGRLAAGIVHEINNPLATIAACAEALENRASEGVFGAGANVEDLQDYLNLIRSEAFRCKSITNGLLDFSRVRSGHRASVDLAEIVRSSANLVAHQKRGDNTEIIIEAAENLPSISADEGQIQQAIIALATNAIDAMPNGGKLTFRIFLRRQRIFLEIEDTGIGIPPENMTKIFEPFFTTKEVGHGTGLGLAVCYGIVTEHGGSLNVRSTVGIGTIFTISLPVEQQVEHNLLTEI